MLSKCLRKVKQMVYWIFAGIGDPRSWIDLVPRCCHSKYSSTRAWAWLSFGYQWSATCSQKPTVIRCCTKNASLTSCDDRWTSRWDGAGKDRWIMLHLLLPGKVPQHGHRLSQNKISVFQHWNLNIVRCFQKNSFMCPCKSGKRHP